MNKAENLAFQIRNYDEFNTEQKKQLIIQIYDWENSEKVVNLDEQERLPHSLIKLTQSTSDFKLIENSPFVSKPVCWLPNVNLLYEIMLVNKKMKSLYGEQKCPSMYTIMALLSHETYMRDIKGDNNLSTGMCQLYKPSAKYVLNYSPNREVFRKLLYFDQNGEHRFFSQKSMIEFVHHFLILEKGYTNTQQHTGVAAYNGAGSSADNYARNVLMKSMFYEALCTKLKANSPEEAISNLQEWTKQPLSSTYIGFNGFTQAGRQTTTESKQIHLNAEEKEAFLNCKYAIAQYVSEIDGKITPDPNMPEPKVLLINLEIENTILPSIPNKISQYKTYLRDSNFFIIQSNRSPYSYLRENTFDIMTNYNNYHFYYLENGAQEFIKSELMVKEKFTEGKIILSNAVAGDTVFVPNDITVYQ
ncbi:MAG: hypothetical protein CMO01_11575 [Thalassobius sp.]|nr:hypothetical protein [Thalassovita sp.]